MNGIMLYLIGLGLNEKGFSREALDAVSLSDIVYLESYTIEFPYSLEILKKEFGGKRIIPADRNFVENAEEIISEAKKKNVALLVYGSPLTATTHISLIEQARKAKTKVKIIYAASVFDAIAETGLQIYKFGKIASMPKFPAESYLEIVKNNQKIKAHSLILIDIGYEFADALKRLNQNCKNKKISLDKIVVCSRLGTNESKIFYDFVKNLEIKKVRTPFCIIIPGEMHFLEQDVLESFDIPH
ncbi:diphthine synthase [Candidatus Pacearchaeota archaeon CG10_big_fil_rev_8_21_14_0_10_34_12]|nr:MAG: diphthine synthase [Candidatus Pacearchaeota archaeon CG10_big_fil_rev_8_21_14_0_10_34_12]